MKTKVIPIAFLAVFISACPVSAAPSAPSRDQHVPPSSPMNVQTQDGHWVHILPRGAKADWSCGASCSQQELGYYGGATYLNGDQANVFWEPDYYNDYSSYNGLMNTYLNGSSCTGYRSNLTQYFETVGGVNYNISCEASVVVSTRDYDGYPTGPDYSNDMSDAQIHSELMLLLQEDPNYPTNVPYNIFLTNGEGVCLTPTNCWDPYRPGAGDFCAYHSQITYNGQQIAYSVIPYFNPADPGCSPENSTNPQYCPNGSDCVADTALTTFSHESLEEETDPFNGGWYDFAGQEIADKCVNYWGALSWDGSAYYNQYFYPTYLLIQGEWDNQVGGCVTAGP